MRTRLLALIGGLAATAAAVSLTPELLAAQAPKVAAQAPKAATLAKAAGPRTADGHPDFQGFYDVSTMTPVDRPRGVKNLVLTEQEAAAMEKYEAQRQVKNDAPLAGDRSAPPVGGENTAPKTYLEFLEAAGGGAVGGYNNFWLAGGDHVIRVPPMKPEAQKRNAAFLAGAVAPDAGETGGASPPGAFDGPESRPLAERCLLGFLNTSGPPTLPNYFYNNMKQIVQTKNTILILVEMVHDARVIRMNAEHLPPTIRKWMGDSVGKWEGDTLVVDTTNFTNKTQFRGSGENLHVVERFTRTGPNTLLYRFTVDDPTTWDKSWTGEYPWNATKENLYEYACHEGNYSLGGMLRGARQKEADDAKKSK